MASKLPRLSGDGENAAAFIKRPRLADDVYNQLYSQLMNHKIPPGGRISIDSLVRELGVSQTPIREALSRLETQGLVEKIHLVGYSAAQQLSQKKFVELYDLRLLLEPFTAERAASRVTKAEVAELRKLGTEMQVASRDLTRAAYDRFAKLDARFHDTIARRAGNELIQQTLGGLHVHVQLFRLFHHSGAVAEAAREHADIIEAIADKNTQAAREAMLTHISRSRERFINYYELVQATGDVA